jgi:hypothetical protein
MKQCDLTNEQRARVQQRINRLKQFRRIAAGYEERAEHNFGMVINRAILL